MQFVAQYQDASGATTPDTYMASATVKHLGRTASNVGYGEGNSRNWS